MTRTLQQVLQTAAEDPAVLRELRDDAPALADRLDLTGEARERLVRADQLLPRARGEFYTITLHTITISGGHSR
ncbi:hypothetical protein ACH427_30635 [Streptomyces sp. NPDC020379]|uniref:hypothetical protein n=1 Tax=Streptomyces sp. NPDC020379 TaxID=3365071 RepID=UPI0037A88363